VGALVGGGLEARATTGTCDRAGARVALEGSFEAEGGRLDSGLLWIEAAEARSLERGSGGGGSAACTGSGGGGLLRVVGGAVSASTG
jgi:hypothetical protein